MHGYTIKNLQCVENAAAKHGLPDEFEARFARQDLGCERLGLSYQRLGPHAEGRFGHTHRRDEEIYVVIGGSGRMRLGSQTLTVRRWDAIRVAPGVFRAFAADSDGIELLAFGTHTTDDVVMSEVHWNS